MLSLPSIHFQYFKLIIFSRHLVILQRNILKEVLKIPIMRIRSIHLRNYKSFKEEQTLELGMKNIILGSNGTGKSTFLSAIRAIFSMEQTSSSYNDNELPSEIELDIDNTLGYFPLPQYFVLKMINPNSAARAQYFVNNRPISSEEMQGLMYNAGIGTESFIMQGKALELSNSSPSERYKLISRISGVSHYEASRAQSLKLLESDDKILSLIERIELKNKKREGFIRDQTEYKAILSRKKELEYKLRLMEILELNRSIEKEIQQNMPENLNNSDFTDSASDFNMVDLELKECKERIVDCRGKIDAINSRLKQYDDKIVSELRTRLGLSPGISNTVTGASESVNSQNINQNTNNSLNANNNLTLNPYEEKLGALSKKFADLNAFYDQLTDSKNSLEIEIKALKYYEAGKDRQEDIEELEKRYSQNSSKLQKNPAAVAENSYAHKKDLWNKKNKIKTGLVDLNKTLASLENKMLYLGKEQINIYEKIKNEPGVLGMVYGLLNVPGAILEAFESVCSNSLYWIVVENEDIASKMIHKIDGRGVFVALNRIGGSRPAKSSAEIKGDDRLIKMSSYIKSEKKYKSLISFICKDYYICSDLNTGFACKELYDINIVTFDGDIIKRNGVVCGGYEPPKNILRDHRKTVDEIKKCNEEIKAIDNELSQINDVSLAESNGEDENVVTNNLKALNLYISYKINMLKNKKVKLRNMDDLENSCRNIRERMREIKEEKDDVEGRMRQCRDKKERIAEIIDGLKDIDKSSFEILNCTRKEKELIDRKYSFKENRENINQKKYILINKRREIMEKIGIKDFSGISLDAILRGLEIPVEDHAGGDAEAKDLLFKSLKLCNAELKKYCGFENICFAEDSERNLREELELLNADRDKIKLYIEELDGRKEQTFVGGFNLVAGNFSHFYNRITGKDASLELREKEVFINIESVFSEGSLSSLSGGQKTAIAVSLLLAMQTSGSQNSSGNAPFYVLDEMDASLDRETAQKVYEIIAEQPGQYFISSFKEEALGCGDRFYRSVMENKASFIAEIDKREGYDVVRQSVC
ncbi:structural maintenance of chromosome 3 (chondroitin sulfate proteoglycan 6) [Enteropsectra breve]|nr:structural maintenance of chromosome 3 (chondroitin sulfate proteoglycan 6) [Enteropsectra breve]